MHLFGLTLHLQPTDRQLYENGISKVDKSPETRDKNFSQDEEPLSNKTVKGNKQANMQCIKMNDDLKKLLCFTYFNIFQYILEMQSRF